MQFQVPQFIESENKIIGDLSFRQFIYLAIPGVIVILLFNILEKWLWLIVSSIMVGLGAIFAFQKINGQPALNFLSAALTFISSPKEYALPTTITVIGQPVVKPFAAEEARMSPLNEIIQKLSVTRNPIPKREIASGVWLQANLQERYSIIKKITGEKEAAKRIDYR